MISGLLGKKVGMTRVFTDDGRWIEVTVLEAGPCTIVQRKTKDTDGYSAVQLGFGDIKESRANKPSTGHYAKAGLKPMRTLKEIRIPDENDAKQGDEIKADIFAIGDRLDVSGTSKGRGFAGAIKRHGFAGGPGGHGSHFHRAPGSIGQSADPAKVYKGKRMPGHYGSTTITVQNLEVVNVDADKNLIIVRGCVPGANGGLITLKKSMKGGR